MRGADVSTMTHGRDDPPRRSIRAIVRAAAAPFQGEEASGLLLMISAAVAVAWANLAGDSYTRVWATPVSVGMPPLVLVKPLLLWINDGLMAIFFFLVGLEIKREIVAGELASAQKAALPVVAALGGMVAPAVIYGLMNTGGAGARGWGIPMATDIAFALGALAMLGSRVAPSLKVFLAAVAIADDLGAVVVIAAFYTEGLAWVPLELGAGIIFVLIVVNRTRISHVAPYLLLGVALWIAVLKSGVHPTIAGVVLAFTIPGVRRTPTASNGTARHPSLAERLEHRLEPWVAFAIMPIFALANAGVQVSADVRSLVLDPVALGIVLGLFFGKQIGVVVPCWLVVRAGLAALPSRATWRQVYGVALLCGIGFTMSLFVATLAFGSSDRLEAAKIGVLAGSLLSGIAGCLVLAKGAGAPPRGHGAPTSWN
jgi:Na+:H+ antiporter, NhaA family